MTYWDRVLFIASDVARFTEPYDRFYEHTTPHLCLEPSVGVYVGGSLAAGDCDRASDVDVVVVTEAELRDERFTTIYALHQRLATRDVWCATQLECTYISRGALRRFDRSCAIHAKLDRGVGERLELSSYDEGSIVQCHLLRTRGITLAGPDPATLIDDVPPAALRQAMRAVLAGWTMDVRSRPQVLSLHGYQAYVVLTLCRIRYTLETGAVVSKQRAAAWARDALDEKWRPLIERALVDRLQPHAPANEELVALTTELIREACELASDRDADDDS